MKQIRQRQRILILSLLSLSVVAPLIFVSHRLKLLTPLGRRDFLEDLYRVTYRTDTLKLNAVEQIQEGAKELEEPNQIVYKEKDVVSTISYSSEKNNDSEESRIAGYRSTPLERNVSGFNHDKREHQGAQQKDLSSISEDTNIHSYSHRTSKENIKATNRPSGRKAVNHHHILNSPPYKMKNQKVQEIKDQIAMAKVYLNFAPPSSNPRLKELELQMKEMERALGGATLDSDLSTGVLQEMGHMETSLSKVSRAFPDCCAMAAKLQAMKHKTEEQVRFQRNQATYLAHLAAGTASKGLHCLSMRLTFEYFALRPEERKLPNENKIHHPELYHYAVFSDNVLACAVVVNSTVSTAKEPEKLVFHIVTNSINLPAISMWFLINSPGKATIHIQSRDKLRLSKYNTFGKNTTSDLIHISELNYLLFYLPDIFPALNKIVIFDHDVVVQQDLSGLWNADMKGNVIGAVGTCQEGKTPFHRIDTFINFSDPLINERFDVNSCTWAFGMNLFDLQQWRRHSLTAVYHKYLQMGSEKPLWNWNVGRLPLGWLTFYNMTEVWDRRWHVLGLGHNSGVDRNEIEQASVIHYDGIRKPWLDIAMGRYKSYWIKFLNFDHPFLQQCNLQA